MKAYKIKKWKENFEMADSRKCKKMKWVAIPNKHDSKGYIEQKVSMTYFEVLALNR